MKLPQNADCSLRKKIIVSFIKIRGTLWHRRAEYLPGRNFPPNSRMTSSHFSFESSLAKPTPRLTPWLSRSMRVDITYTHSRVTALCPPEIKVAHTRLASDESTVPELIQVLGSQPAGVVSHKLGGRLPLLSARPAVTPATLKRTPLS